MDAIEMLKADHDRVNAIFQQFQQGGGTQEFQQLFNQLYQELSVHSMLEETEVYPMLAKFSDTNDKVKDVYEDHAGVKAALAELAALDNTSTDWSNKMTKLMHDVQNHVREEEGQIFPHMRQHLGEQEIQMLGQQLQMAKQIAMQSVQSSMPFKQMQSLTGQGASTLPADMSNTTTTSDVPLGQIDATDVSSQRYDGGQYV